MNPAIKNFLLILLITSLSAVSHAQELTAAIANDIKYGRIQKLEKFTDAASINKCLGVGSSKKYNFLAMSIKLKSLKSLKYFVENGADLNGVCADKTPLMYAAKYGQLEHFKYLVEQGADLDIAVRGNKALNFARRFQQREIIRYIKDLKAH